MMKKRVTAAALSLAVLLGVLTGCGAKRQPEPEPEPEPEIVTAGTVLEKMNEAMTKQDSASAELQMSMGLQTDSQGVQLSLPMDMQLSLEMVFSPLLLHAKGNVGMELMGMSMDIPLELYAQEEDDDVATYVNVMDSWMKQITQKGEANMTGLLTGNFPEELAAAAVLAESTEEVQGKTCLRVEFPINGNMLGSALGALQTETAGVDFSQMNAKCVLWIEEGTNLPVRQTVSFLSPLGNEEARVTEMEIVVDYTGFGNVGGITIPPEALNAQIEDLLEHVA